MRDLDATRSLIARAIAWGLAITVMMALAGGVMLSRRTMRRLEAINETSRRIMRGDRDLLFQAFANLLDNAIKYTPRGGDIRVSLEDGDSGPRIRIIDSGPGIPEQSREQVFKRFFRLEDSRHTPGNGLGLSLVEAVARLHKADIHLGGEPGLDVSLAFPKAA
jgi:signal transduction histidine kinase